MEKLPRHNFVIFPYRPERRDDGDDNIGGIDLTQQPERLNEIHEIRDYPWMQDFLGRVNAKDGLFMTFGCALGYLDDAFCGYVDFSLRPDAHDHLRDELPILDEMFFTYLSDSIKDEEVRRQGMEYARNVLHWTLSPLEIHGLSYAKLNLKFYTKDEAGAEWVLGHVCYFLTQHYRKK